MTVICYDLFVVVKAVWRADSWRALPIFVMSLFGASRPSPVIQNPTIIQSTSCFIHPAVHYSFIHSQNTSFQHIITFLSFLFLRQQKKRKGFLKLCTMMFQVATWQFCLFVYMLISNSVSPYRRPLASWHLWDFSTRPHVSSSQHGAAVWPDGVSWCPAVWSLTHFQSAHRSWHILAYPKIVSRGAVHPEALTLRAVVRCCHRSLQKICDKPETKKETQVIFGNQRMW